MSTINDGDHPRGCGESSFRKRCVILILGSPPRMRGKLFRVHYISPLPRITPADAGKTSYCSKQEKRNKDHPRGCGENILCGSAVVIHAGSPPRMRGKLGFSFPFFDSYRITPADAGKTASTGTRLVAKRDHPRGCGENFRKRMICASSRGSPPRMRGKPLYP